MPRARAAIVIASLCWAGCPSSPAFVENQDVAPEVVDSASDSGDAPETADLPGLPCERDCIVQVTAEPAVAFDARVDDEGRATVAVLHRTTGSNRRLVLRRYDGTDDWTEETVAVDLPDASSVALGMDGHHGLQLIARAANPVAMELLWYHPSTDGGGWTSDGFRLGCDAPRLLSGFRLWLTCVDDDRAARFYVLDGADAAAQEWALEAQLEGMACVDGEGNFSIPAYGWSIDVLERPIVGRQFCPPDQGLEFDAWRDGQWSGQPLGQLASGAGATRRNVVMASDVSGLAHIVHQDVGVGGKASLVERVEGDPWQDVTIDVAAQSGDSLGELVALATDNVGRFHLVYEKDHRLVYRHRTTTWSSPVVAPVAVGAASRLALTVQGTTPHVVFEDADGHLWWWTPASAPAP